MLAAQRRDFLLDRQKFEGLLVAGDLAHELQVSEDSVRRDLREQGLDRGGFVGDVVVAD